MQTIGYIQPNSEKVLVLVREGKTYRDLKIRTSGKDGQHFRDEELFFEDYPDRLAALKDGKVIRC